jgi:hypothetical protein
MISRQVRLAVVLAVVASGCSDAYLYNPDTGKVGALDRAVSIQGQFCSEPASNVINPTNILFVLQTSSGMARFDPNGTGAKTIDTILKSLPQDPNISIGAFTFAGDVTWITNPAWVTNPTCTGGAPGFVPLTQMGPCLIAVEDIIENYEAGAADAGVFRDATDFIKPLTAILTAISEDLSQRESQVQNSVVPIRPVYQVVFVSAGQPAVDEDAQIAPLCQAIAALATGNSAEVHLNTVYVQEALVDSVCPPDAGPQLPIGGGPLQTGNCYADDCGVIDIQCDSTRLESMAELGNGQFRNLRSGQPIDYLNFNFGGLMRQFVVQYAMAYNLNARPNSPVDQPDSDGDGLSDSEELNLVLDNIPCPGPPVTAQTSPWPCGGLNEPACIYCMGVPSPTDPTKMDTDGDGFSDGVEVYMHRLNGTPGFDPSPRPSGSNIDPGCPSVCSGASSCIGSDVDGDHVLDCDETLLGMSFQTVDSDGDGMADAPEWLSNPIGSQNPVLYCQPTTKDATADPDRDGLTNVLELRGHTNPGVPDVANLTSTAARYQIELQPVPAAGAQQCYDLRVDNVLLVPTLDTGEGPGINHIVLYITEVPEDDVTLQPIFRAVELKARYPLGGIKDPPDGLLLVQPSDFVLKK